MIKKYFNQAKHFLQRELWVVKVETLPSKRAFLYRTLRVWYIAVSEFMRDRCGEKASALTYLSFLSVVPVLAMAFGIATSFGLKEFLLRELQKYFAGQDEVLNEVTRWSENMLSDSINGGLISGISVVFLIYAVAKLMNNIEDIFNKIWATKQGRSLKRKITDYIALIFLGPIVFVLSSSAATYLVISIDKFTASIELIGFIRPVILFSVRLVPYTLIWFLLFSLYIIFPNTSVKLKPALWAGILAGTLFQLTQFAWIEGQVYLSRYNTIYGSLAFLPLFMIWLQLSWTIILFGAEFSFAIQNVRNWSYDNNQFRISQKTRRSYSLYLMNILITYFLKEERPLTIEQLCGQVSLPGRLVREIVAELERSNLIIKVDGGEEEKEWYVPGLDVNKISVYTVYDRLQKSGLTDLPQLDKSDTFTEISQVVDNLDQSLQNSPANKLVKEL